MPHGYVIVDLAIEDADRFKQYQALAPATIAAAGGEYLVRGGASQVLEGDWQPARTVVLRFPSVAQAKAWYEGEAYRRATEVRRGATSHFHMIVVEGVAGPA